MKFKNKVSGVILEPSVPMVTEMLKKNPDFELYEEPSVKEPLENESKGKTSSQRKSAPKGE